VKRWGKMSQGKGVVGDMLCRTGAMAVGIKATLNRNQLGKKKGNPIMCKMFLI